MKFIISGGGTGGHIYPAIAIANELKNIDKDAEILFVGALGKMEMEKVPKAGYKIIGLNIVGIERKLSIKNLLFPFKLLQSIWKAKAILKDFKPDAVIGVGGYASAPLLYAANSMNFPTLIQEQNSFAGMANKWLSKKAKKICVAYQNMDKFFPKEKILLTGNPVRQDILHISEEKKQQALKLFGLNPTKTTILVIGGSLGARSINETISDNLQFFIDNDWQLIWQTGKNTYQINANEKQLLKNPLFHQTEFIYQMDLAYSLADVIVSRAGALAVSEICLVKKPTIFVPFPFAAEDHQTQNALALVNQNAAEMVKDNETKDFLMKKLLYLVQNKDICNLYQKNLALLAKPNASNEIAQEVIKLVK
ncbi:MAG: undecaprenyldiphospho-muramoylpentapeptide beta-N-acetylglucosaminyltransferase [Bacteroidetes bacterium]|nr:MAG: undecaprenyldiphospho-muramoylpentapeptide beta-N-acetylglucosaminyltransferase [Bacteroidota bacterium]TAG88018.1 MAG: undecaprenyldiphospho-muramoylpentapeptide beta-N-acetylglucosaminyltransferase [Bacteroidota bacterium]